MEQTAGPSSLGTPRTAPGENPSFRSSFGMLKALRAPPPTGAAQLLAAWQGEVKAGDPKDLHWGQCCSWKSGFPNSPPPNLCGVRNVLRMSTRLSTHEICWGMLSLGILLGLKCWDRCLDWGSCVHAHCQKCRCLRDFNGGNIQS